LSKGKPQAEHSLAVIEHPWRYLYKLSHRLIYINLTIETRVYNGGMKAQSRTFRLRAIQSEQRARDASDSLVKAEWDELAIEWHLLANAVAQASGEIPQIDVA
jgi:hypothetical protein